MNRDLVALRKRIFEIVNFVNVVSQTLLLFFKFLGKFHVGDGSQPVDDLVSQSGAESAVWMFPFSWSAGVQAPEDLHCPGGLGDLVQS